MLSNLKLGYKISSGFALILGLLIIVVSVSMVSFNRADEGLDDYRALSIQANLQGRVQAHLLMARMQVKDYLIGHQQEDLEAYKSDFKALEKFLEQAKQALNGTEEGEAVQDVIRVATEYDQAFAKVANLVHQTYVVNDAQRMQSGELMRKRIAELLEATRNNEQMNAFHVTRSIQEHILTGPFS